MKIAQVTPRYYPNIGGVEKFVQKISEELVEKGYEVDVLTADAGGEAFAESDFKGVTIKRFPPSRPFHYSSALHNYLITHGKNYELVHAHSFHTLLPLLCAGVKEKGGFKLVLMGHYHGKGRTPLTSFFLQAGRSWFTRNYQKADLILCHTEYEKKLLMDHFKITNTKIKIIPSGTAIEKIRSAEPFAKTGKILLIVSRLEKYKNIQLAIWAMPYLPEDYQLVVAGDGPYRKQLERIVAHLDMKGRVKFTGRLSDEEIYRWYKTCDLVLNLSDLEAFGLTVIEGRAAGKPVLVNNCTALSELAQRFEGVTAVNAWKIGVSELAKAIKNSREMPIISKTDLNEYKWDMITNRMLEYYKDLL